MKDTNQGTMLINKLRYQATTMPASWKRMLVCILPYFYLLGKYSWLKLQLKESRMKNKQLKRELDNLRAGGKGK